MVERDDKSNKIIKAYYKAWCTICIFTVTAKSEITAKKAIIAHIISHHRDVWINHEPDLVKE
jgi:predicted restriction endonuclease